MKVIRPNCRSQFTPADYEFLESILPQVKHMEQSTRIIQLLKDPDSFDILLDNPRVFRALLEVQRCLTISMHFYFYVLVRHVLLQENIRDREVADYVAEVLAEFALLKRLSHAKGENAGPLEYLSDMVIAMENMEETERFAMQTHIGNYSLFLSGLFPNQLQHRVVRRGAPGFKFYEELGSANYRMAGNHCLARKFEMVSIFNTLGHAFHVTRIALNHLSEKICFLETNRAIGELFLEIDNPNI